LYSRFGHSPHHAIRRIGHEECDIIVFERVTRCRSPSQDLDFTHGYENQIEAGLQTDRKLMQCTTSWTLVDGFKPEKFYHLQSNGN
jgi:hypothetical protein